MIRLMTNHIMAFVFEESDSRPAHKPRQENLFLFSGLTTGIYSTPKQEITKITNSENTMRTYG